MIRLMLCLLLATATGCREKRRKLTVRASYDECKTWKDLKTICESQSAYSDLAILPDMIRSNESTGRLLYGFDGKGIGHFPKSRLDCFLILGDGYFLFYFGHIHMEILGPTFFGALDDTKREEIALRG